jgi:hypothetical protein
MEKRTLSEEELTKERDLEEQFKLASLGVRIHLGDALPLALDSAPARRS